MKHRQIGLVVAALLAVASADTTTNVNIRAPTNSCPAQPSAFPRQIELDDPAQQYHALESGLQIFLDYSMPCNGFVTEFRFLSAQTVIWGLHLAIFRPAFANSYRIVNELYLDGYSTNVKGDSWVIARPSSPMYVRQGDFVGIFYDEFNSTQAGRVSIRSFSLPPEPNTSPASRTQPLGHSGRTNCLVYTTDASAVAVNKTVLDQPDGQLTYRDPALYVMLARFPNSDTVSQQQLQALVSRGSLKDQSGENQGDNTIWSNNGLLFRDLKCNLNPNVRNQVVICGKRLALRYFFDIADRKCKQFLGCEHDFYNNDQSTPAYISGEGRYYTELTWDNNFPTQSVCYDICGEANYRPGRRYLASSTTASSNGNGNSWGWSRQSRRTAATQASTSTTPSFYTANPVGKK